MKNYVLVHGAWGGAWAYDEVIQELSADGSRVIAHDLPGHKSNKGSIVEMSMTAYVQSVVDTIEELGENVILVGHSLAGMVISQVAERMPDRIDSLVYVCAFLPKNGDSAIGLMQSDQAGELLPEIVFSKDQSYATVKAEDIRTIFLHDVDDEARLKQLIPKFSIKQATEPFMVPAQLTQENFGVVPKYFVRTTLDKVLSLSLQNSMISNWNVKQAYTLESGHFPLVSMPTGLADILKEIT